MIGQLLIAGEFRALGQTPIERLVVQAGVSEAVLARNAFQMVTRVGVHQPEVILMDLDMPDGLAAWQAIRATSDHIQLLVCSPSADPTCVMDIFRAGASGYLFWANLTEELIPAMCAVAAGGIYLSPVLLYPEGFITAEARHWIERLHGHLEMERHQHNSKETTRSVPP